MVIPLNQPQNLEELLNQMMQKIRRLETVTSQLGNRLTALEARGETLEGP